MGATSTASNCSSYYQDRATSSHDRVHDRHPISHVNESELTSGYIPHHSQSGSFSLDDAGSSLAGPPSYALAMTRIRRNDPQRYSRINTPPRMIRHYQSRSSSLPRGIHHYDYDDNRRGSVDCFEQPSYFDIKMAEKNAVDSFVARSVENLSIMESTMGTNFTLRAGSGRRLPEAPIANNSASVGVRQPAFSRQRRARRAQAGGFRSQSAGRLPRDMLTRCNQRIECFPSNFYNANLPSVRAQLIGLDHRGFRTVLIEKLQPGPFGFYIATGMLNQKRGIFISRVSIPSLAPVLSVGDEILYVEDELIKGRSLEYVQSLIAGKTSVTIVLLPSVGPALC
uniref:PDZ domain-containing protein n=1 Tax=Parascaris univalens TaxID=6257 RepID=A0A915AHZ2_PARUN